MLSCQQRPEVLRRAQVKLITLAAVFSSYLECTCTCTLTSCCRFISLSLMLCNIVPCRLLNSWVVVARKRGVKRHNIVHWVRRKVVSHISIWRWRFDGSMGCATPCVYCFHAIVRFDLKVHCSQADVSWYIGRLTDQHAPLSMLTSGQKQLAGSKAVHSLSVQQR